MSKYGGHRPPSGYSVYPGVSPESARPATRQSTLEEIKGIAENVLAEFRISGRVTIENDRVIIRVLAEEPSKDGFMEFQEALANELGENDFLLDYC